MIKVTIIRLSASLMPGKTTASLHNLSNLICKFLKNSVFKIFYFLVFMQECNLLFLVIRFLRHLSFLFFGNLIISINKVIN